MKIFISYDFSNNSFRGEVEKWLTDAGQTVVAAQQKHLQPEPDQKGRKRIKEQISGCDRVVVLLGNDGHNRPWLDYEISVAVNKGKKIIAVRLPGTTGAAPREIRNKPEVPFSKGDVLQSLK